MGEVDPAFIQEPEHKPRISYIEGEGIPVIDLSPLHSSNKVSNFEGPVKEIGNACKDWGFFQVINHGVSLEKCQKIEKTSRRFFAQSLEEKRKVKRTEKQVLGYYDSEHTKNVRDLKEVFDFIIEEPTQVEVWSNDEYESVEHRMIVNSEKERYSYPYFLLPALSTMVKPLEELTNKQNLAKYRA